MQPILNIAGYKFISLNDTSSLREIWLVHCQSLGLKGTILLSHEGININLAGTQEAITAFKKKLIEDMRFTDISFHQTYSDFQPFKKLKIKLKKEIITLRQPTVDATKQRAPAIAPALLKQWLDEKRNITLLDTRNDYEVNFGTFKNAVNLQIDDFTAFPATLASIEKNKPIVMFCTGGIRCEKAALYLLNQGHEEVYQLDGGILGYFAKVGGEYYEGECFVFDQRVSLKYDLTSTLTKQCQTCQGPITTEQKTCLTCDTLTNTDKIILNQQVTER
ncbi:MAG: sulfurtransferase [Gammaproteobacteria bacterium]|nr:sulfurtransferase [Gammaproteobacteria bacterium]